MMMAGLLFLYFTQLHLLRCTTHTSDSAASPCSGYNTLMCQLAAPLETTAALTQAFKEPVEFFYSTTYVHSTWTHRGFFIKIIII